MKMKAKVGVFATMLGALVIAAGAMAGSEQGDMKRHHMMGMHHGERMMERMAEHLGLDDGQRTEIEAIYEEFKPKLKLLHQESKESHKALAEAIKSGASQGDINLMAETQGDLHADMISVRAEMQIRIRGVMTEEQLVQMDEMRDKRKMHHKQRRGERKGHDKGDDV